MRQLTDLVTPHFSYGSLIHSNRGEAAGIDNTPNAAEFENLEFLCRTFAEPVRALLGVPLIVTVAFRCPALNALVFGVETSEHLHGLALDFFPKGLDLTEAFHEIRRSDSIVYDQLILEEGCIHGGVRRGEPNRHEAMIRHGGPGNWTYEELT